MSFIAFRFALGLAAIAAGILVLVLAANPRRQEIDPALRLLKIALLPELFMVMIELSSLVFALNAVPIPLVLSYLFEGAQFILALAYVRFTYRHWQLNGLSLSRYLPFLCFIVATVANFLIFTLQFPFPAGAPGIHVANKVITASVMLYAGICAVVARAHKSDFYPSTRGAFWMALFCIAYAPLVGLPDMFSMSLPLIDPDRSVSLQLFPLRELIVLAIYALHMEPFFSKIWKARANPADTLSSREGEVAALMRQGLSNADIASELNVSLATVKSHVRQVLRKSGVASRRELAASGTDAKRAFGIGS